MTNQIDTLTVGELKELLSEYDDDTLVMIGSQYGDYWQTTVADKIGEYQVNLAKVEYSEYHKTYKQADSPDKNAVEVLVIGEYNDSQSSEEECEYCYGTGEVEINAEGDTEPCDYCRGMGYIEN